MARCRFDGVERRPRCVDHQLAPWKVTARWRCPVINAFVSSLSPPVTSHQNQTLRRLPRGRSRPVLPFFAHSLRTPTQTSRRPHLVDETFGNSRQDRRGAHAGTTWCECYPFGRRRTGSGVGTGLTGMRPGGSCASRRPRSTRGRCSKKIWPRRRRTQDFRVALVTMTLTHCRTCAFRARFFYVAFHLGPWLKGFCAVA